MTLKNIFVKEFSDSTHGIQELLRLSDALANQSFYPSDIWRVQLESNWTVGESMLAFGQEAVREWRVNLLKGQWSFLQCLIWKIIYLENIFSDGALSLYIG